MTEPVWLTYVGAACGIVGALTGIAGAVMGYVSYRRTDSLKKLDLRVEVRKLLADTHRLLQELPDLVQHALASRRAIASATGNFGSGRQKQWEELLQADRDRIKALDGKLPDPTATFEGASEATLETQLLALHELNNAAAALRNKYLAELASDDKRRDQLREAQQVVTRGSGVAPRN